MGESLLWIWVEDRRVHLCQLHRRCLMPVKRYGLQTCLDDIAFPSRTMDEPWRPLGEMFEYTMMGLLSFN